MPLATLQDLLVPGVTGGIHQVDAIGADVVARFKTGCHAAARAIAGTVTDILTPRAVGANYHLAHIVAPGRARETLLLHSVLPLIAAAAEAAIEQPLHFISIRRFERFFDQPFLLIEPDLLNRPLTPADITGSRLDELELKDIAYWKPDRIGDLVFNCYD